MIRFLDASVLVAHLTASPEEMARAATARIRSGEALHVSVLSLLEVGFVLESVVRLPREAVADAMLDLVREPFLHLHGIDYHLALQALLYYRHRASVDLGDALLWAIARYDRGAIYTFDRRFMAEGVELLKP